LGTGLRRYDDYQSDRGATWVNWYRLADDVPLALVLLVLLALVVLLEPYLGPGA
jgi:hypothetical protein